jgi:hypothetical protein
LQHKNSCAQYIFFQLVHLAAGVNHRPATDKWHQSLVKGTRGRHGAITQASWPLTPGKKTGGTSGSGAETPKRTPSPSRSTHRSPRRSPRRFRVPRRSRTRREVIVERVVREGGGGSNWPQLTRDNYHEWSLRMQLKMQARHLWDAVEYDDVDYDDDRAALDAICSGVPGELIPILMAKNSAKEAWEAIKTLRIGDERVRKATAQNLRAEYESIALRDREPIEDFALRLTGIVQR